MRAQPPTTGSFLTRCLRAAVAVVALAATARGDAFDDYALFAPEAAPALNPTLAPNEVPEVETTQYFEEALTRRDPAQEAQLQALVDAAVAARLAGIPRPRYIPMTDLAPPKGLILLKNDPRRGEFPFAMALGGYMQLRWFEFARDATQWTNSTGRVLPINNINTFNINRFLLSFHGHVVDERLVYNLSLIHI